MKMVLVLHLFFGIWAGSNKKKAQIHNIFSDNIFYLFL